MKLTREQVDALSEEERKAYILSIQSPMTQAIMTEDWNSKALFSGASPQVLDKNGNVDINVRYVSPEEEALHKKARLERGAHYEVKRSEYLNMMIASGKISKEALLHSSLKDGVETRHVMPTAEQRESAILAWMGKLKSVKERFVEMMGHIFQPSYAERVAQGLKEMRKDDK